jgi:Ni/Co efflux regulator RcnB
MNSKLVVTAGFAAILMATGSAYAQPIGTVPGDPYVLGQHPADRGYVPIERQMRRSDREEYRRQLEAQGWATDGRGAGPYRRWHTGERLPYEYRHRSYVVQDWRGHRLYRPPSGYHWVQAGDDYVLVAIATGIIAALALSR